MKVESVNPVNSSVDSTVIIADEPATLATTAIPAHSDAESKVALDHATGLLQSIVTDKISDKVIRKMPSDEYLHLLSLLDEIISGSIDKHV